MTKDCQNCESPVTDSYARVFSYPGETHPRICPECPGKVYGTHGVRDAKSTRDNRSSETTGAGPTWVRDGV